MKKPILISAITIFTSIAHGQVTNGLVARYSFNNGNANDEVGNNNGVVTGATLTTDRFGNANKAYSFDGNDYINFGDTTVFQMGSNDFSISIWINYSNTQEAAIFQKRNPNLNYTMYTLSIANDPYFMGASKNIWFFMRSSTSTDRVINLGDLSGGWHNIVISHKYADSTSVYVDGQFVGSSSASVSGNYDIAGHPFVVGSFSSMDSYFYTGQLDDIRIYNRALDETEVDSLFNEINPVSVGLDETTINQNYITVYPNPTKGKILLSNTLNITLTDITGKIILVRTNSNFIDISNQPRGIYFLSLTDDKGQIVQRSKVMKE